MKKAIPVIFICFAISLYFFIGSCKKCNPLMMSTNPCDTLSHTFSADIFPVIKTNCSADSLGAGCHGTGSVNSGGPLTNYQEISNKASLIQTAINGKLMPPLGHPPLSQEDIDKINCWVNEGAPND